MADATIERVAGKIIGAFITANDHIGLTFELEDGAHWNGFVNRGDTVIKKSSKSRFAGQTNDDRKTAMFKEIGAETFGDLENLVVTIIRSLPDSEGKQELVWLASPNGIADSLRSQAL